MDVGLYFGSFNPIHTGHLIIANHILNETTLKKVWFIVSPQNPLKPASSLLNEYDRLHLARIATEDDVRIQVSDIEFKLPRPSYTIDTLTYLSEKYPDTRFSVILGGDSYNNLPNWKNYESIVKNFAIYVYKRDDGLINALFSIPPHVLKAPLLEISATEIRNLVKEGKSIRYLVPEKVREEIERNRYYKANQNK
jgi:nicotinate-nucleotide adenylyltransferase